MIFDFLKWCEEQNPDTCPFRNGAEHTTPFGLRTDQSDINSGASPGHLGNDRGLHDGTITMPFDGAWFWKFTGGDSGSLLQIIPRKNQPVEIQVFHTSRNPNHSKFSLQGVASRSASLPVKVDNLGFSFGPHTHTALITEYSDETRDELTELSSTTFYADEELNYDAIKLHCNNYELDYDLMIVKLEHQIMAWGILELHNNFAVTKKMPDYRKPHWGNSKIIYVDTESALKI